jgi:hypothetical protein
MMLKEKVGDGLVVVKKHKYKFKQSSNSDKNNKFGQLISKIKEDDNPVLIFAKLNPAFL